MKLKRCFKWFSFLQPMKKLGPWQRNWKSSWLFRVKRLFFKKLFFTLKISTEFSLISWSFEKRCFQSFTVKLLCCKRSFIENWFKNFCVFILFIFFLFFLIFYNFETWDNKPLTPLLGILNSKLKCHFLALNFVLAKKSFFWIQNSKTNTLQSEGIV